MHVARLRVRKLRRQSPYSGRAPDSHSLVVWSKRPVLAVCAADSDVLVRRGVHRSARFCMVADDGRLSVAHLARASALLEASPH